MGGKLEMLVWSHSQILEGTRRIQDLVQITGKYQNLKGNLTALEPDIHKSITET